MSIQQEIILRYNDSGHVRFQIPECLCRNTVAPVIADAILKIDGVYRVNLFRNKQKLAIRFTEESLSFTELNQQLLALIIELENKGHFNVKITTGNANNTFTNKLANWKGTRWAKDKYVETKETAQAISILTKLGLKKKPEILKNPEQTLITFFNDVLILFLIKTHWKLITKKWLLDPMKYRYQWITTFYLMYLFIRSKTNKANKNK